MTTKTTTPAKIRRAQRTAERLANLLIELRQELPEATNSEQELADGTLLIAFEHARHAASDLISAARYLADTRTEDQIQDEQRQLRGEEAREEMLRRYGCTA